MEYEHIAEKIVALKNADLELRDRLVEQGKLGDGYNEEMEQLHSRNAEVLNKIIDSIGYPTISKVGKEASQSAWLVIQHSIGQPDFMRKCVCLLKLAVSADDASSKDLAYLTDRIAVYEGRTQLFGTQFDWDEHGALSPQPYDDIVKVNQRRISIGLKTIEEQIEIIRRQSIRENQSPPADNEKRKRNYDQWRRKVGWIQK